jgi:hypothetical protein
VAREQVDRELLVVVEVAVAFGRLVVDNDQFVVGCPIDRVDVPGEVVAVEVDFEFAFGVDDLVLRDFEVEVPVDALLGRWEGVNAFENRVALYPLPTALLGRFAPCVAP